MTRTIEDVDKDMAALQRIRLIGQARGEVRGVRHFDSLLDERLARTPVTAEEVAAK